MAIYAEYLFLENSLAGLVILLLTKKICGFRTGRIRFTMGCISCGLYAFTLFLNGLPWWLSLLLKLAFSLGVVTLVFYCNTWKQWSKGVLVFYLVSFAMGGITIGAMYFFGLMGVTAGGVFYIGQINYLNVFLGMALTWLGLSAFASFIKEKLWKSRADMDVQISIGAKTHTIKGMVDTGNFLIDPLSGKPVFLVTEKTMNFLVPGWRKMRLHLIPYKSVGRKGGLLPGVRPDQVVVLDQKNGSKRVNVMLGVYKGSFPVSWDGKEYDLLLHPAAMEGGIFEGE